MANRRTAPQHSNRQAIPNKQADKFLVKQKPDKDGPGSEMAPPEVYEALETPSRPLEDKTRRFLESRFDRDFGQVRVHADHKANESARVLGAAAYTVEHDIVFARNRYDPDSFAGLALIAHEIAHTAQAASSTPENGVVVERSNDVQEAQARAATRAILRGETVPRIHRRAEAPTARLTEDDVVTGAAVGAGVGLVAGAVVGGLIGGPLGALAGGLIGAVAGGAIGAGIGAAMGPFPTFNQIVADRDVQTQTDRAWRNTEAAATPASRREEGFWIRLNTKTNRYEFTPTILGAASPPLGGASVDLGARPADSNPGTADAIYTVASFHTHTPTAHRPVGRPVGPSGADNRVDTSDDVVGVVYDYIESPAGSGNIPAGHPIGSPAKRYHSGPNRRQRL